MTSESTKSKTTKRVHSVAAWAAIAGMLEVHRGHHGVQGALLSMEQLEEELIGALKRLCTYPVDDPDELLWREVAADPREAL